MPPNYSMQGFSLSLVDGVIELHADGEHDGDFARGQARAFKTIAGALDSRLILNDVRRGRYALSRREWEDRMRFVARTVQGYRIAYVIRPEQAQVIDGFIEAHARLGDEAAAFRSKAEARAWLRGG